MDGSRCSTKVTINIEKEMRRGLEVEKWNNGK